MRADRLVAGILCVGLSIWLFASGVTGGSIAPAVAIAVLGIIMIAISRKK